MSSAIAAPIMTGRPALYTAAIAERILGELANGRSLSDVCENNGMPGRSTVRQWVSENRGGFAAHYKRARQTGRAATGRPSLYSAEIAERILAELSNGRTVDHVCDDPGMPSPTTVRQWVKEDREGFAARYRQLKRAGGARTGRPTTYTAEIAERILEQLSDGRTLADVCRDPGMPAAGTVWQWTNENREGFAARYWSARRCGCHLIADEILTIADDSRGDWTARRRRDGTTYFVLNRANIGHARLRIGARRWLLSKALPRHYGKRPDPNASLQPATPSPRC
jgi:transposase-like protein